MFTLGPGHLQAIFNEHICCVYKFPATYTTMDKERLEKPSLLISLLIQA